MTTTKVKCLNSGEEFVLDDSLRLGAGNEGEIYRVPGNDDLAIKIYKPKLVSHPQAAKLKAMVANPPDDHMRKKNHASIAWPMDLVSNAARRLCALPTPRPRAPHHISHFLALDF